MLKTLNTTNSIFQIIAAELEAQQTQNTTTPVAQQEVTPKYTKITKTPKKAAKATIKSTYKSFTIQHGHFVPSQNKNNIKFTTHTTTLNLSCITLGYNLAVKVNGQAQVSVTGDDCYTDWKLKLQAGDRVEVEVLGGKSTKNITYTINEDGVVASASEGVNHTIKGTHKADLDIQDKYRKQAAQQQQSAPQVEEATVEVAPVAQIEEETVPAPAQEEKVLTFGKHTGKSLSTLDSAYLKWLVAHESRLAQANRWACTAAKAILAARQEQAQTINTNKTTSTINKIATRKNRVASSIASLVAAKVAQAENIIATGEFSKSVEQTIERKLGVLFRPPHFLCSKLSSVCSAPQQSLLLLPTAQQCQAKLYNAIKIALGSRSDALHRIRRIIPLPSSESHRSALLWHWAAADTLCASKQSIICYYCSSVSLFLLSALLYVDEYC